MADVHDGVVLELHREVVPHARQDQLAFANSPLLGLPHRPDTPAAVPVAPTLLGGDFNCVPTDRQRSRPRAGLGQALGVEDDLAFAAQILTWLGHRRGVPLPGHVHRHAVLGRFDHHSDALEWFEDLDAKWPDRQIGVVGQRL